MLNDDCTSYRAWILASKRARRNQRTWKPKRLSVCSSRPQGRPSANRRGIRLVFGSRLDEARIAAEMPKKKTSKHLKPPKAAIERAQAAQMTFSSRGTHDAEADADEVAIPHAVSTHGESSQSKAWEDQSQSLAVSQKSDTRSPDIVAHNSDTMSAAPEVQYGAGTRVAGSGQAGYPVEPRLEAQDDSAGPLSPVAMGAAGPQAGVEELVEEMGDSADDEMSAHDLANDAEAAAEAEVVARLQEPDESSDMGSARRQLEAFELTVCRSLVKPLDQSRGLEAGGVVGSAFRARAEGLVFEAQVRAE